MIVAPPPPGPPGHLLLGNLPEFKRDMLGFIRMCAREYGDVVPLRLGPVRALLLSHPDAIETVLVKNNRMFTKHFSLRLNRLLLGNGLLTSEGDFWLRQRRLAQPAFHRGRVALYGEIMVAYTERLLATWREGETRDIHAEMTRLALEIVVKTLFDADVAREASDIGAAFQAALASFDTRQWLPIPEWVPTPGNVRLWPVIRRLNAIIYGLIEQRRRTGHTSGDLLSLLLEAQDEEDGSRMTDKQLRDEVATLFLAGHETTALALTWTWYLLAQHRDVEAKLVSEVETVLGGRAPTVADLPSLRYAEMVVLESMRLYPPAYGIGREAIHACEVAGYRVAAGTTIFMSQWVVHRDSRFFEEPEDFRPNRWAGDLPKRLPKFAYFPFGGGPRVCIGSSFAFMEAILVLATIAPRFRMTLVPGHPVTPWPSLTLRPEHGIRAVLTRR